MFNREPVALIIGTGAVAAGIVLTVLTFRDTLDWTGWQLLAVLLVLAVVAGVFAVLVRSAVSPAVEDGLEPEPEAPEESA